MITTLRALLARARERSLLLDHLIRMYQRYQGDNGDRLAAAVTFYWFLSLFPILLIAVYVTSLALGSDAGKQVTDGLAPYLGKSTAAAVGKVVQNSAGKAGIIGLAGVLLSGLGWITALRQAVRAVWHEGEIGGNFITKKIADIVTLVGLFAVIAGSVFLSGAATAASSSVLDFLALSGAGAKTFTIALSYLLGGAVDVLIFLFLFLQLAKVSTTWRQVLRGSVFGAIGFEVIKAFGALYISHTTTKGESTYGTFAVVVGLLLFLNLVSRLLIYTAAFVVTGALPIDPMVQTADVERSWEPESEPEPALTVPLRYEKQVTLAARAIAAASGAVIAGVGIHATRTVVRVLRS